MAEPRPGRKLCKCRDCRRHQCVDYGGVPSKGRWCDPKTHAKHTLQEEMAQQAEREQEQERIGETILLTTLSSSRGDGGPSDRFRPPHRPSDPPAPTPPRPMPRLSRASPLATTTAATFSACCSPQPELGCFSQLSPTAARALPQSRPLVSDHPRYRHSPTPFQPEPPAAVKVTEETDATASRSYQTPVSLASYGPRDVCQASSDLAFISITVQNTIFPTI
ncbi:hypothetical protein NUW54_g3364 [Trametes sanguinea]|uniref:Uncharacterized protein n=1 Tax=Trametes sanguinea TaxID=158606 RepID=A0ACC1Q179_9APHY|nr:hypothetical protein NUW54_g3364 [Trametes sanguinea]